MFNILLYYMYSVHVHWVENHFVCNTMIFSRTLCLYATFFDCSICVKWYMPMAYVTSSTWIVYVIHNGSEFPLGTITLLFSLRKQQNCVFFSAANVVHKVVFWYFDFNVCVCVLAEKWTNIQLFFTLFNTNWMNFFSNILGIRSLMIVCRYQFLALYIVWVKLFLM